MKFISWNVNGLRACCEKGFRESFKALDADFFCLQETKMQAGQLDIEFDGYKSWWNYADKKGYSGTAVFSRHEPLSVSYGMGIDGHDHEGRIITLEMPEFYLVNVYTPNSQDGLARLDYRMNWEDDFRSYLLGLEKTRPVIVCGDLNVAHKEIDLKNPVRRPECGPQGNRPQEPEDQQEERRLHRRGTRKIYRTARKRIHRHIQTFLSGCHRHLFLVVLQIQVQGEECRVAHRLFPCVRRTQGQTCRGRHPQ